ncbi:hypothetical protein EVC62_02300 [Salinicola endophyticus]|uniref:Uncharacterized protein n=1 Tax=Salinicola endophyticus TaxID=1949083 RepID=A0ABY8FC85_9GAMM|nr:hypothetical protein [Salinicola endophyticus]WFF40423.1 hypothetical protein EVC62_02300 [Salinicola endophyticus]
MRLIDLLTQHPLLDIELPIRDIFGPLGFEVHIECHEPPIAPEDLGHEAFETYARSPDAYIASLSFEVPDGFVEVCRFENEDAIVLLALKPLTALAELLLAQEETGEALAALARERRRQVEVEGWTTEHDDQHGDGSMADAAGCYALYAHEESDRSPVWWPWDDTWWKPSACATRDLEKAGALTLAEIERLARAEQREDGAA